MDSEGIKPDAFPAKTKTASGTVNDIPTEVVSMSFSDKLLITITQGGRLTQWIQVPLLPSPASGLDPIMHLPPLSSSSLMPGAHLTPTTVLGAGTPEMEARGRLLATQTATMLSLKNPDDRRLLVLGLGLEKMGKGKDGEVVVGREEVLDALELVSRVV